MNPWPYLTAFPPIKIRLLARTENGRKAITAAEIAIAGGFTLERVEAISRMADWEGILVGEMRRFCNACNFNPFSLNDRRKVEDYERKCLLRNSKPFGWLRRSPAYQTEFLPLIRLLSNPDHSQAQHVA